MVPEFLPGMHIGHMHFHAGQTGRSDRIADGIAVMGIRARVDDDTVTIVNGGVNTVNERAFGIGLEAYALSTILRTLKHDFFVDRSQCIAAIDARFAAAGQVQVGSMYEGNFLHMLTILLLCHQAAGTMPSADPKGRFPHFGLIFNQTTRLIPCLRPL